MDGAVGALPRGPRSTRDFMEIEHLAEVDDPDQHHQNNNSTRLVSTRD